MQLVPVQAVPNQQFSVILDGNTWKVTIRETNGCVSVSLNLNTADVLDNARAAAGSLVIPSEYEEAGNFFFLTAANELPDYEKFNTTQSLVYVSAIELAAYRVPEPPPVTATDFNPIAALPLRFSPAGYV